MDKKTVRKYLDIYISRLKKHIHPMHAIVYGSFLTDKFNPESDVDLIIVSDYFGKIDEDERFDLLYKYTVSIPLDLHIYGFTPEEIRNTSRLTTLYEAIHTGVELQ